MEKISMKRIESIREVELTTGDLSFEEFIAVAKFHARLRLSASCQERIAAGRALVEKLLDEECAVYGVTTGFGDNINYTISRRDAAVLQKNLLRSHACSVGEPLPEEEVRAILLMIIVNTGKGYSGIKPDTLALLCDLLNQDLYPFAPGNGSVGYLSVEAHICLTLIGEGYFIEHGAKVPASQVLKERHLLPVEPGSKEGLSLISGTTSVTALSLLSLYGGMTALNNIQLAAAMAFEALRGTTKAFDPSVHSLKKHPSQQLVAENMRRLLKNSRICEAYREAGVQDPSLLRTIPQVLGSCHQLIRESYDTILSELHSVSDNPVVFPGAEASEQVRMTGNFDGSFVGTHCDMLAVAYANLGNFVERCTDRLVNHHLSNGLPPFLIANPGINNGFMIPQYTQAALQSELKLLAVPASIDSITTCAGQEDPVSMAYHAASKSNLAAKKLIQMTGILMMPAAQALEVTVYSTQLQASPATAGLLKHIRLLVPFVDEDRYLYQDIEVFLDLVQTNQLTGLLESELEIYL